jgi:integrase
MYLHAIRFLYLQVLHWPQFDIPITYPKKAQKIPELLTRAEVARIIQTCRNDKHQMMLLTCYGCGLRVSELTSLKVAHIDGERQVLRIEQGKGAKDRMVDLSSTLLDQLRDYWCQHQPNHWLFPNANTPSMHLSNGTIQRVFKRVKQSACIDKVGGIHGLRHAYATHQLENGMAIHRLQHQLGHNDLHSTLRYVHWLPSQSQDKAEYRDLIEQLALDHG